MRSHDLQMCCKMCNWLASPGRWWLLGSEPLEPHKDAARPGVSARRECPCDRAAGSEPQGHTGQGETVNEEHKTFKLS